MFLLSFRFVFLIRPSFNILLVRFVLTDDSFFFLHHLCLPIIIGQHCRPHRHHGNNTFEICRYCYRDTIIIIARNNRVRQENPLLLKSFIGSTKIMIRMRKTRMTTRMTRLMLARGGEQRLDKDKEQQQQRDNPNHPRKTDLDLVSDKCSSPLPLLPEFLWRPLLLARFSSLLRVLRWDRGNLVGRV